MKKELGQFYTTGNPFKLEPFKRWFNSVPDICNLEILEPFAGSNNIVNLVGCENQWKCFDISPGTNTAPQFPIEQRDTIANYPTGFKVAITNPPYLGKSKAKRFHIDYAGFKHDDLYKDCLEVMLANTGYVAAIVPESFINSGLFHSRLSCVISLASKMFADTTHPVCLALFSEQETDDFEYWLDGNYLGTCKELSVYRPKRTGKYHWKFNDPDGKIGLRAIDNTISPSIAFKRGELIPAKCVTAKTRHVTRISTDARIDDMDAFLAKCNQILSEFRDKTSDVFLSNFYSLREDGKYRRRLDYTLAKAILDEAMEKP